MSTDKRSLALQIATRPLRVQRLPKLTDAQRNALILLYARGYTARRIAAVMLSQYGVTLTDPQILYGGVCYAESVDAIRGELAESALTKGLALRSERVRRTSELAEAYEGDALSYMDDKGVYHPGSTKAAGVVLKAYDQIADEMEEIGLQEEVVREDPWYKILKQMAPQEQNRPLLEAPEE